MYYWALPGRFPVSSASFSSLSLKPELLSNLDSLGYKEMTPIQAQSLPHILDGKDVIGKAKTGSGKTAAFALGLLNRLEVKRFRIQVLVMCPTRELADQVSKEIRRLARAVHNIKVLTLCGGMSMGPQIGSLEHGAHIVVGTPGRLLKHIEKGRLNLDDITTLVLDEADRMLDMGFSEDLEKIVGYLPKKRTNLLFSATMPPDIRKLAKAILTNPVEINIALSKPAKGVVQAAFLVYEPQKLGLIVHLLKAKNLSSVIVFCSTRKSVTVLERGLRKEGILVGAISSDLDQKQREEVMIKFKNGILNVLVATNIVSRGIDIVGVELVINYDVPRDAEDYVHRVGRTARADAKGIAFTFISEEEQRDFHDIEKLIDMDIKKIKAPAHLGNSPDYNPHKRMPRKQNFKKKRR
jgi:ATP-dependent RNA helicase DbpA